MRFPFFKSKRFEPDFPIVALFSTEEDARSLLSTYAEVTEEGPGSDETIAKKLLVAQTEQTRVSVGIWDGRVRFANYLTSQFNQTDDLKGRKLGWFIDYYGGAEEFDTPKNTGFMIFWRNPKKKLLILFGLHMGPVRVIDEDPTHWQEAK